MQAPVRGLNDQQLRAVTHTGGPLLVLAGAGTGKTRVITARIAWLIAEGAAPENILAVTFTNKAAREMKERIGRLVKADAARAVTASTFHSLCVRILRAHAAELGYTPNFSIFDESDQEGLIKRAIAVCAAREERLDHKAARYWISQLKNKGLLAPPGDEADTLRGAVFLRYQEELRRQNAMDFDDLVVLAARLLRENAAVRERWRKQFRHILVDEFQDTNAPQLELTRLLAEECHPDVCAVGDDDQSIYGWRGADLRNILQFERHFPGAVVLKLEQNYRSTPRILAAANRVIAHNASRRGKSLWSADAAGEPVRVLAVENEHTEAEWIVREIWRKRETLGCRWEDFAILFRVNTQARILESELRRHRVPYKIVGARSFFDRREVKDLLAWLGVVANARDDQALLRALGAPPRGIGEMTVSAAIAFANERGWALSETLASPDFRQRCTRPAAEALARFDEEVAALRVRLFTPGSDPGEVLLRHLESTRYFEDLRRGCRSQEEFLGRQANLRELLSDLSQSSTSKPPERAVRAFLDDLSLDRARAGEREFQGSGAALITLHAAKGLEFDHVFLAGAEEGLLPHLRSLQEGTLDEERRLFYVGVTRARRTLVITHCLRRQRGRSWEPKTPSRFLDEMEGEGVERESLAELMRQPATTDDISAEFARLRFQLAREDK